METIKSLTTERDELVRQIGFLNQELSARNTSINEANGTLASVKDEILIQTTIRDYVMQKEIPNVKSIVAAMKNAINQ